MLQEITKTVKHNLDKKKADLLAEGIQEAEKLVETGTIDAYQWLIRTRQLQTFLDGVLSGLIEPAKIEVLKQGQGNYVELGQARIAITNTGDRYDYDKDPVIANLKQQLKERTELVKLANQAHAKGKAFFDPETGEVISPVPVKIHGKETITVQL